MKLLIRNLARSTTEAELRAMFSEYGMLQSCTLVIDRETGRSKGFAFVEMPRAGEAKAAMKNLNGREVAGSKIRVKKAEPKQPDTQQEKAHPSKIKSSPAKSNPWNTAKKSR